MTDWKTRAESAERERDEATRLFTARDEQLTAEFSVSSKLAANLLASEASKRRMEEALRECIAYISSPVRMSRDEDEAARRSAIIQRASAALSDSPASAADDKFAYWNSLPESEKAKIRQGFHDDMYGGTDD